MQRKEVFFYFTLFICRGIKLYRAGPKSYKLNIGHVEFILVIDVSRLYNVFVTMFNVDFTKETLFTKQIDLKVLLCLFVSLENLNENL